jgi:hypothetical protein
MAGLLDSRRSRSSSIKILMAHYRGHFSLKKVGSGAELGQQLLHR